MPFVHDESNDDVSIPRNRVRAELLPLLERRFNPSIVDVLADEAMLAREEWDWMQQAAREAGRGRGQPTGRRRLAPRRAGARAAACRRRPARRFARRSMEAAAGRPVSFRHVEDALQLLRRGGGPVDGPGLRVERRGASLVLTSRGRGSGTGWPRGEPFPISAVYSRRGGAPGSRVRRFGRSGALGGRVPF